MSVDQAPFGDIQRIVLRPSRARYVTHFPLRIRHAETTKERGANLAAALRALRGFVNGGSWTLGDTTLDGTTTAEEVNAEQVALGFTVHGLRALELGREEIETFPFDFRQGPADRADFLGDVDRNGPEHWDAPFAPTDDERKQIHAVVSVWSDSSPAVPAVLAAGFEEGERSRLQCDSDINLHDGTRRGWFGYSDGDSQPYIDGLKYGKSAERHPRVPLGEFIVGHPTELGDVSLRWRVPGTDKEPHERVGWNATFAALRVMEQRPDSFEEWLDEWACRLSLDKKVDKELIAAWVCGRSRPGSEKTLENWPHQPGDRTPFDFSKDLDGRACPIGSHIRRAHPRNGWTGSRGAHRRRIIRRGAPYGIATGNETGQNEWAERGLVGYFICANLSAQYEAVLTDWIHGGVHDPWISGTNDPLIGRQPAGGGIFRHDDGMAVHELRVPQFVFTKGVAYLFLPGRTGLERLIEKCEARLP